MGKLTFNMYVVSMFHRTSGMAVEGCSPGKLSSQSYHKANHNRTHTTTSGKDTFHAYVAAGIFCKYVPFRVPLAGGVLSTSPSDFKADRRGAGPKVVGLGSAMITAAGRSRDYRGRWWGN